MFYINDVEDFLNGLLMKLFCSIVRVGTRRSLIFHNLLRLILVGMLIIFESAPESIKRIYFKVWCL